MHHTERIPRVFSGRSLEEATVDIDKPMQISAENPAINFPQPTPLSLPGKPFALPTRLANCLRSGGREAGRVSG